MKHQQELFVDPREIKLGTLACTLVLAVRHEWERRETRAVWTRGVVRYHRVPS